MNIKEVTRRHLRLLAAGVGLGVLGATASLAQPYVIGKLVEAAAEHKSLVWPIVVVSALFCAGAALAAGEAYLVGRAGENIVFDLRRTLTGRLLRANIRALSHLEHGDIFTRMVTDTSLARVALAQALSPIITSGFMVVGGIALMAWIDVWLLALTLTALGAASVVSLLMARRVRTASVTNRQDTGAFGSGLQRVLGAMPTVKASRAEQRETDRICDLARQARRSGVRVSALSALLTPAINVGTQVSLTVVIASGMTRVATGGLALADLTAFVMYLFYLVSPLVMLFVAIGQLQQGRAALDRVTQLGTLEQEEALPSPSRAEIPQEASAVVFEGVTFSYSGDPVLDDVSFTVPARGLTAIVGLSGAGKTTLFQLIERFYHPDAGTVRVCGADAAQLPLDQLRGLVGYVEQDTAALRGTVRDNLTYANPGAADTDIARAVRLAGLTDVIAALPDGLHTQLGERGAGLSGGQRQRLAIARTLLQDPQVVLLDEATAHLDAEAEAALRETITAVAEKCAVIAITHRISTVVHAEQILVLEQGQVRATGTHDDLMRHDSLYPRLAARHLNGAVASGEAR